MINKWTSKWLVALLGSLAMFSVAMAADPAPSGTVTLSSKAVAIGVGVSWGDGVLTVNGKTYPFSVEGLSVADLGISSVTTSGEVFNLKNVADFSGKGLGSRLMESIMDVAREKGLTEIDGLVLAKNPGMLKLMKSLGFSVKPFAEDPDFMIVTHQL